MADVTRQDAHWVGRYKRQAGRAGDWERPGTDERWAEVGRERRSDRGVMRQAAGGKGRSGMNGEREGRDHIDKPISAYTYQLLRTNELRKTLILIVVYSWNISGHILGTTRAHLYFDDEKTSSQSGGND